MLYCRKKVSSPKNFLFYSVFTSHTLFTSALIVHIVSVCHDELLNTVTASVLARFSCLVCNSWHTFVFCSATHFTPLRLHLVRCVIPHHLYIHNQMNTLSGFECLDIQMTSSANPPCANSFCHWCRFISIARPVVGLNCIWMISRTEVWCLWMSV